MTHRRIAAALAFFTVFAIGCGGGGSSSGDSVSDLGNGVSRSGNRLTSEESHLVLTIPSDVPASVSDATLRSIYLTTADTPGCGNSTGQAIDIVLAEACLRVREIYLFRELLPSSLDGIESVEEYVDILRDEDPFTQFFNSEAFEETVEPILVGERAYIGVAVEIVSRAAKTIGPESPLRVTEILPFTRAWYDGLAEGDEITAVDGQGLDGLTVSEVFELLPHTEGAETTLSIKRGGESLSIPTAAEEHISFLVEGDIAYLDVRGYSDVTGRRVREDFEALVEAAGGPVDKVVLDLRDNGGGSVRGALELTDYLIDNDEPPQTNLIMAFEDVLATRIDRYLGNFPTSTDSQAEQNLVGLSPMTLAVLVDEGSASAAEVTVAALEHYGTATLIGVTTFGKGVGQNVVTLLDGSGLFVTSQFTLDPAGESFHEVGIEPDIVVTGPVTQAHDPQLEAAITWLTEGAAPVAARSASTGRNLERVRTRLDQRWVGSSW